MTNQVGRYPMRSWPTPSPRGRTERLPLFRRPFRRPRPGYAEVYGAIIHCRSKGTFCFVQGRRTGKWSFPKGHLKEEAESPFECVTREVGEEIGCDDLPTPLKGMPLRVGYYYMFEVPTEFELAPRDVNEVGEAGWFTLDQMRQMNMNIDASYFRSLLGGTS